MLYDGANKTALFIIVITIIISALIIPALPQKASGFSGTPAAAPAIPQCSSYNPGGAEKADLPAKPRLFILAIGINEYKNKRYTLKYSRTDAEAFVQTIEEHGKKIFSGIIKQTLYDSDATREHLEATFDKIIAEIRPQDVFVFYYAGHGVMSKGSARAPEFFMALSDVTNLYGDPVLLEQRGFSACLLRDFSARIKAKRQLLVLDACNSGGALASFRSNGKGAPAHPVDTGLTVLTAAGASQPATEFKQIGHGVFTYALLKGLAGEADSGNSPEGKITVRELESYLNTKVPELIKYYRGKDQSPHSFILGSDFELGIK